MKRTPRLLLLLGAAILFLGMAGRGNTMGGGELKAEIRLKYYNQAIQHFENAKTLYAEGRVDEALQEIHKATKIVRAFPEAYELAQRIYLDLGNQNKALEQEGLFKLFQGDKGASLYRLRDKVAQEVELRKKFAAPPDVELAPCLVFSGALAGFFLLGMVLEYRRVNHKPKDQSKARALYLETFPDEWEDDFTPTTIFKFLALLLPVPFLFSILVLLGFRQYSDLIPVFLFGWAIVDFAIYLIFFADLSGFGGFRRPGMGG